MMTVSILGCGWLGSPLAIELSKDYEVKGSTTSPNKLSRLQSLGIDPYLISLDTNGTRGDVDSFLDTDVLYINIPPRREETELIHAYKIRFQNVLSNLNERTKRIIFISSTSVYNNVGGVVTESERNTPESKSAKVLLEAEELVKESGVDWIILRMAGLIGPNRDPGKWFAGKTNIPNGLAPINLVHLDDCVEISKLVVKSKIGNETFNVCVDNHPSRKDFYSAQTKRLGLQLPVFKEELNGFKEVSNDKLKKSLGYEFIHSDFSSCTF
tara:strand:+ start:190 stop:996 length:807 start_codon:yes stop_codon:yes gene_type:complete